MLQQSKQKMAEQAKWTSRINKHVTPPAKITGALCKPILAPYANSCKVFFSNVQFYRPTFRNGFQQYVTLLLVANHIVLQCTTGQQF